MHLGSAVSSCSVIVFVFGFVFVCISLSLSLPTFLLCQVKSICNDEDLVVVDVVQEEELKENMMMMTWLYLCRRRSGKITSIPRLTTGKSKRQIVPCQSLIIKRLMTSSQKLLRLRHSSSQIFKKDNEHFIERKFACI